MKDISTVETGTASNGARFDASKALGVQNGHGRHPANQNASKVAKRANAGMPVSDDSGSDGDEETEYAALKARFHSALVDHYTATEGLGTVVQDMIAEGIERDEAIEWGLETGLSEQHVRNTVSALYSKLVGRKRKKGAGRKGNTDAQSHGEAVLEQFDGDFTKALAYLLAARRHVEKLAKAAK